MAQRDEVECALCRIGIATLNNIPMELRKFVRDAAHEWSFLATNRIYNEQDIPRIERHLPFNQPREYQEYNIYRRIERSCGSK